MRIIAISKPRTPFELDAIDQMHRLRARIFQGRLAWNVACDLGREFDEFDRLQPTYILALTAADQVIGCARLLPADGVTMVGTVFRHLLRPGKLPLHGRMVESSRFCVDTHVSSDRGHRALHGATLAMFAGIVEWSIASGYDEIVTATDVRFERILARAGWPMSRLGDPIQINETLSIAGVLPADRASFEKLRPEGYLSNVAARAAKAA